MGLFTNRKDVTGSVDYVSSRDAIDALQRRNEEGGGSFDSAELEDLAVTDDIPDEAAPFADHEIDPDHEIDTAHEADTDAALALADVGISLEETEPELPPGPNRRSSNYFVSDRSNRDDAASVDVAIDQGVLAGSAIDIDVDGLLGLLGVAPDASLSEISAARLRFLAEHDPQAETRADAAEIKERIRRQINTAYASFRLARNP